MSSLFISFNGTDCRVGYKKIISLKPILMLLAIKCQMSIYKFLFKI